MSSAKLIAGALAAAAGTQQSDAWPHVQAEFPRVYLHACGRLEAAAVEHLTVADVAAAARAAFDFPDDQDLALADKDGVEVTDDSSLARIASLAETLYIRFPGSALHDFERRIDQLQHLQIGFFCDQLTSFRQDCADVREEIKQVRMSLEQDQGSRAAVDDAVRREVDDLRALTRRQVQSGDDKLEALEKSVFDMRTVVHDEALARDHFGQEGHRKFQELRDTILVEGKARENGDDKLRLEVEELRRAVELEVADREDAEARLNRGMQELRETAGETVAPPLVEVTEVRRQLMDVKQALAVELRERVAADSDVASAVKEIRSAVQGELRERGTRDERLTTRCGELETNVEAERIARQQAVAELAQQLGVVVESFGEEQELRSSEDAQLSQMVEILSHKVDEARKRLEEAEQAVRRTAQDLSRRFEDEAHARELKSGEGQRALEEERSARHEADGKVGRAIAGLQESIADCGERSAQTSREHAQRLDACVASVRVEQKERVAASEELSERLLQQRRQLSDLATAHSAAELQEVRETLSAHIEELARGLREEQKERAAGDAELVAASSEARGLVDAREKTHSSITRNATALREGLEEMSRRQERCERRVQELGPSAGTPAEQAALISNLRNECLDVVTTDLGALREGLTKVVEAVQQERRSRSEGDNKLREDCREAIQKEINARLEKDAWLRLELEKEALARQEAVEVIQQAIEECRQGLETHTHEFDIEDGGAEAKEL